MKISDNTLKVTCNTKMQVWNIISLFSNGGLSGSMLSFFFLFFFGGGVTENYFDLSIDN